MYQSLEASDKFDVVSEARFVNEADSESWRKIDACLNEKNQTDLSFGSFQTLQLTKLECREFSSQVWREVRGHDYNHDRVNY